MLVVVALIGLVGGKWHIHLAEDTHARAPTGGTLLTSFVVEWIDEF